MGRGETIYNHALDAKARYYKSLGCNDAMVARQFGVTHASLIRWKAAYPSFRTALHSGMVQTLETGATKKDAEETLRAIGLFVEGV